MYAIGLLLFSFYGFCVADMDKKMLSEGMTYAMECAAKNAIEFDVCAEMFKEGINLDDAKYAKCKCWVPCVAKKMKAMKEDGTWDEEVVNKMVDNIKSSEWKEEALKVLPKCKELPGKDCEVGFNAFSCVMKNSDKARNYVHKIMKAITGQ